GQWRALPNNDMVGPVWPDGQTFSASFREDSSRGTAMFDAAIFGQSAPLQSGRWSLIVHNPSRRTVTLQAYVADEASGWLRGVAFVDNVTDEGTVCWPATADAAITVG